MSLAKTWSESNFFTKLDFFDLQTAKNLQLIGSAAGRN